ncbi:hypothetical protein ABB37_01844 [Leptomonas pyrrhocoris]|uniref:Uncharacterized protein n=1 Tax=Leptomonas pyrrhocoris TaxID=157538 RepID=A0A0N0VHQ4_LEPPY|nr:hypothetical protein ABB37_01844 [Leptomonas pyrrhocoris]KPA85584.1 hypothetical protein ABB37_01844 [Leptomonas pyrrhocoris]|eukprot:XP_015664023.1 hypothetical protein ABB37_01844 [Leptomonas pyrrhocoris]
MRSFAKRGLQPILARTLTLRPEATVDPVRYPLGYVPIDGTESTDSLYALLKRGYFVAPLNRIECIHRTSIGVRALCRSEYPVVSAQDVLTLHSREKELLSRLLIRRDFWTLDDFNDPELNQSFGIQNLYFDNYKWSQVLWKRFQAFAEEYFPLSEHTHLLYSEYMQLIRSFSAFEQGVVVKPALSKSVRLHPPYGAVTPTNFSLEPILLLKNWLLNFKGPLMVNKALVPNSGSGVTAFAIRACNVPMVRGLDSRPRFVAASRKDAARYPQMRGVSFQVAELLPPVGEDATEDKRKGKYDLIAYYPDEEIVSSLFAGESDQFAPTAQGLAGKLEEFFESVAPHMTENGIIAVCCTNIHSLLFPAAPHPVEYEIKINRRFVVLDYYDTPARFSGNIRTKFLDPVIECKPDLKRKLRSELWVLHKVESISHYGFIHGIPGAKPPNMERWRTKQMGLERQKALKNHVRLMGGDWGNYKSRFVQMLQEQTDEPEDDVAESIRMAFDPTYPVKLAEQARIAAETKAQERDAFHRSVALEYQDVSPRHAFEKKNHW